MNAWMVAWVIATLVTVPCPEQIDPYTGTNVALFQPMHCSKSHEEQMHKFFSTEKAAMDFINKGKEKSSLRDFGLYYLKVEF